MGLDQPEQYYVILSCPLSNLIPIECTKSLYLFVVLPEVVGMLQKKIKTKADSYATHSQKLYVKICMNVLHFEIKSALSLPVFNKDLMNGIK